MRNEKEIESTIRLYIIFSCLWGFAGCFAVATYATFLRSRGLNLFEANLVNVFFFATITLFEVPTGIIADVFGRKRSFVIALAIHATGHFCYFRADSFWGCVLAEVLAAIGFTCFSGAFQAWACDRLKFYGYDGDLGEVMGRCWQWQRIGIIVSALIGAWSAEWNIALPWLLGASVDFAACFFAMRCIREEYFVASKLRVCDFWQRVIIAGKVGLDYVRSNPKMRFIAYFQMVLTFCVMTSNMQWQIFFGRFYTGTAGNGYIWLGVGLTLFFGAKASEAWKNLAGGVVNALCWSLVLMGVGLVCTTLGVAIFTTLPIYLAHTFFRGIWPPIQDAYVNEQISEDACKDTRATILSAISMIEHVAGMSGLIFSGLIAEYISLEVAWISSGLIMMIGGVLLLRRYINLNGQ